MLLYTIFSSYSPFCIIYCKPCPKANSVKNYNLLPRLKNINYICNNKPKFHNNVTRLARQT